MGKITVKHYLNTNLKPYVINGEKYFSIYALVTANRQNTKIKSKAFNEYYTENDFKEISNPENKEDYNTLKNEEDTIMSIASLIVDEIGLFDTTLFAGVYNYFQSIYVYDLDVEMYQIEDDKHVNIFTPTKNKLGIDISELFSADYSLKENQNKGMSLYTWFSTKNQNELDLLLGTLKGKNISKDEAISVLNRIIFYQSFDKLSWIFKGSNKFMSLIDKYYNIFEMPENYLRPLYAKISI